MSKPAGRNNSKIITRNQGGGNKKQGLAPLATQFFISQANNVQYRTESGDGRNRDLVICVNQLGGIGKGRSQFRANADGKRGPGCEDEFILFQRLSNTVLVGIDIYRNYFILENVDVTNNGIFENITTIDTIKQIIKNKSLEDEDNSFVYEFNINNNAANVANFPIIDNKIYMFDLSAGSSYVGDANYINVFNNNTFSKSDTSYNIKTDNIISFTDFSNLIYSHDTNFNANSLNMYYTESNTKLGYWYIDTSVNIKYNNNIESKDISTISITTDYLFGLDLSLNKFYVSAFNNNFSFTDSSSNLIFYNNNKIDVYTNIIAFPINLINYDNYQVTSNGNFIIQGKYTGDAIFGVLEYNNNILQMYFYRYSNGIPNTVHIKTIESLDNISFLNFQKYVYNISPNGDYLAYFNNEGFLEIYKFNGATYNLYKTKRDKNYLQNSRLTIITSINTYGTIISLATIDSNYIYGTYNVEIYRIN